MDVNYFGERLLRCVILPIPDASPAQKMAGAVPGLAGKPLNN